MSHLAPAGVDTQDKDQRLRLLEAGLHRKERELRYHRYFTVVFVVYVLVRYVVIEFLLG